MSRMTWLLRRKLGALDHLQLTLAALIVAALLLFGAGLKPRTDALRVVEQDLGMLASHPSQHGNPALNDTQAPATDSENEIPPISELPNTLEKLKRLSGGAGIELLSPRFSLTKEKGLYRYQLVAETESPYRKVRTFIRDLPLALPASSVDSLQMQLIDDGTGTLSTQLNISFYFRPVSASTAANESIETK